MSDRSTKGLKLTIVAYGQGDVSIRRREGFVGHDVGVSVAVSMRSFTRDQIVLGDIGKPGDLGIDVNVSNRPLTTEGAKHNICSSGK